MAVNKVVYGNTTLVDLTSDTVTADNMAEGVRATGADGTKIVGLLPKVAIDNELSLTSTNPVQNKTITAALSNLDIDIATNDEIDNALNLAGSGDLPIGGGIVPIAMGGTGATTTAGARANLGVSATTDYAAVAFSGAYDDLTGKPAIPTATGDLTNNSGYITNSALRGYVKSVNGVTPDSSGDVTISVSGGGSSGGSYTLPTASSSTLGGVKIGSGLTINTSGVLSADVTASTLTAYAKTTDLAAVAKTGSYNDLTNKPTIPAAVIVDDTLDADSTNAIQNKAVYGLGQKFFNRLNALSAVASSGSYNDLADKPGNATTSTAGFMSATDKAKLDGIDADAGSVKMIVYS